MWEEVQGQHFYTLLAIQSGLHAGSSLALRLGDPKAAEFYSQQAAYASFLFCARFLRRYSLLFASHSIISHVVDKFWSPSKGIIRVSLNHTVGRVSEENAHEGDDTYGKGSELDTATLLAVLHAGKGTKWEANPMVLATLDKLIKAFGCVVLASARCPAHAHSLALRLADLSTPSTRACPAARSVSAVTPRMSTVRASQSIPPLRLP